MRAALYLGFATVWFLTGCPGDDGGSDPADLVGTWREIQGANDDPSDRETLTINADGTYSRADVSGPRDTGTYDADSDRVMIQASFNGEDHTFDQGYLIAGDQLAVGTLSPEGDVDGLVGVWHGEIHQDGESIVVDVDLRADGTATYHATSTEEGPIDFTGTWAASGVDVIITWPIDENSSVNIGAKYIAGKAIADKLYQRQP
jgi:hypothetical protein